MKRKILLIVVSVIVLILIMGSFAIYKLGDIIIEKALEAELSELLSDSDDNNFYLQEEIKTLSEKSTTQISETDSGEESNEKAGSIATDPVKKKSIAKQKKKVVKAEENQTLIPGNKDIVRENRIPPEKIKEIKDRVSAADKMKAGTLVLKRLDPSEIDELVKMLEGGVTREELKKAKELVYERFTADEIAEIKEIYRKYMYG